MMSLEGQYNVPSSFTSVHFIKPSSINGYSILMAWRNYALAKM